VQLRTIDPGAGKGVARDLLSVQRAAYAVETELLGDDRIPPSRESLAELRRAPLSWLGALRDDRLVGAAGWSVEPDVLDIVRPVVSPEVHRRGVGSALVRRVLAIAGDRPTLHRSRQPAGPRPLRTAGLHGHRRDGGRARPLGDRVPPPSRAPPSVSRRYFRSWS
jgi:GNAT superfamily N-acetyltransferase